jgi:hemerythrin
MTWSEDLAVGVAQIDQQHRELFRRFDDILEACRQGHGRSRLVELHDFLAEYVETHFGDEEALMRSKGYPRLDEHLAQHAKYRTQMESLSAILAVQEPSIALLVETNQKVMAWLMEHIRNTDRALAAYLG